MEGFGKIITDLFSELWKIWKEMFGFFAELIPRLMILGLWILCGIIILPSVFIAGTFYPKWSEWGEKL